MKWSDGEARPPSSRKRDYGATKGAEVRMFLPPLQGRVQSI
jgi:hypothetical protein